MRIYAVCLVVEEGGLIYTFTLHHMYSQTELLSENGRGGGIFMEIVTPICRFLVYHCQQEQ